MGEALAKHLFKQLVDAVTYLHTVAKVVHRDLKLENIVLDRNFSLKLCDFAMSKTLLEGNLTGIYYSQLGSERYMAPEIIEGKPYKGTAVDIFALGVILFAMVTGVMPFDRRAHKEDLLYSLLIKNEETQYWQQLDKMYAEEAYFIGLKNISDDFKKLIVSFFKYHYFERITLDQLKQSSWL
ncbi:MAG: protein kinase domain-containing protein [bacterium]